MKELAEQPAQAARKSVLIISHDVVGTSMAGPGIRYWELTRVLSQYCDVTLLVPTQTELHSASFKIQEYNQNDWFTLKSAVERADVVMPCGFIPSLFPQLTEIGNPIVIDGYDLYPLEAFARAGHWTAEDQRATQQSINRRLQTECRCGDFFLCASERQRDWWLGILLIYGRINAATYQSDPSLRNLIDTVPFGCESTRPKHTAQVVKGVIPGISLTDRVLVWGGGIWDWLDPLTLLRAMPQVIAREPNVRLIFPGTKHPNPIVPDMEMRWQVVELADQLGLTQSHVFFGDWVPYSNWHNYLLEADIGVSLHKNSLETHFAFRSRIFDYIRAGLPMVVNNGDITGEIVQDHDIGLVVECGDVNGTANAIIALLSEERSLRYERFLSAQAEYTWERVAAPLVRFCKNPYKAADYRDRTLHSFDQPSEAFAAAIAKRDAEIIHLRKLASDYEKGRFMRLMRWVKRQTVLLQRGMQG